MVWLGQKLATPQGTQQIVSLHDKHAAFMIDSTKVYFTYKILDKLNVVHKKTPVIGGKDKRSLVFDTGIPDSD